MAERQVSDIIAEAQLSQQAALDIRPRAAR